ncbi:MAG: hemolysin family protein [Thermoanaerobaculia bacterium]
MIDPAAVPRVVWLALPLAGLVPLLSVATAILERAGPIRLRHWVEESGGRLRLLWEDRRRFAVFRFLLNVCAKVLPLALCLIAAVAAQTLGVARPFLMALLLVTLLLAVAELGSRRVLLRSAEDALNRLSWFYRVSEFCFSPVIRLVAPLLPRDSAAGGEAQESEATEEEVEAFIDVGTQEGILEPEDRDLVWGVVDFGDTQVRSVMTPRVDMICGRLDDSLEELADRFADSGHSRLPLFRDSIDQIGGVVHLRDLVGAIRKGGSETVASIAKPPFFVPETKLLGDLLKELQARRQQMAIVLNEFGGTEGLVTVEDLIEEIVGEIADEHDDAVPENRLLDDGSLLLDGRAAVDTLHDFFGVEAEGEGVETVGGLLTGALGRVPLTGEQVAHSGLHFEIENADERRVLAVRVRRHPAKKGKAG